MSETSTGNQTAIDTALITPAPGFSTANPPPELCAVQDNGFEDPGVSTAPDDLQPDYAEVTPPGMDGRTLSLVVLTIEPGGCLRYHRHEGANVLYVLSGEIDYAAQPSDTQPDPVVLLHEPGGFQATPVSFGVFHRRAAGQWVTQDRDVFHSLGNPGSTPAVVVIAANSNPDEDIPDGSMLLLGGCIGGCRGKGR